jgi:hypothetical protein
MPKVHFSHFRHFCCFSHLLILFALCLCAGAAEPEPFKEGWPRLFEHKTGQVVVYQPQLTEWKDYQRLSAKAAVAVTLKGQKQETMGAVFIEATTEVDFSGRMVVMKALRLTDQFFPNVKSSVAAQCQKLVNTVLPAKKVVLISLDRVLAGVERSQLEGKVTELNYEPPPILYSEQPAILVQFMGEPKFESVPQVPGLLYAVNTNWDILMELGTSKYYMLNTDHWLVTDDLAKGRWQAAQSLPDAFRGLPEDDNWKDVKKHIPGKRVKQTSKVFISQKPTELIVTQGAPSLSPIPSTKLLYITNTTSDLFLHMQDGHYYFLTAGRWFKAKQLSGPWTAASRNLPEAFGLIPVDHEKASVLASVPGTSAADVAVLLASVPRKATVERKTTKLEVVYEGDPILVQIEGTSAPVYYAVNSPYSVFRIQKQYYCCHNGIWFIAKQAKGPWAVCDSMPGVIYTIPSNHPKHYVTYAYVYSSTPTVVVVGYTSGYSGCYVAPTGVLMFGVGFWAMHMMMDHHHHYHHYHYHPHYYSYGCGARYDYHYGSYYRSARYYGPYGGAGGWAGYDPGSGTYYRGGYAAGPYGRGFAREAYNPYTNRYGAQARVQTPYQSWGRTVVSDGDRWARAGHRAQNGKAIGGLETSAGGRAVGGYNKWTDQGAVVGKDRHGDVYVGRDQNVYKRNESGWQKNSGNGWESIDRTQAKSKAQTRANELQSNRSLNSPSRQNRSSIQGDLNRQWQSRQQGNRASRARGAGGVFSGRSGRGRR